MPKTAAPGHVSGRRTYSRDFMSSDFCCWACRTPFGCGRPDCEHHIKARQQQDADDRARRVVRRPTEDKAIANIMREKRQERN